MSSFSKNILLILTFCAIKPVSCQSQEKSQLLEFVNDEAIYNGIILSGLSYGLSRSFTKFCFDQYHRIGIQQESEAQKENATAQAKRIGKAIKEVKETLKKNIWNYTCRRSSRFTFWLKRKY